MSWTKADKKRVRAILDRITANSSLAELARDAGTSSRSTAHNWYRRGQVPVEYHVAVVRAASACSPPFTVTPAELHPDAKTVEQAIAVSKSLSSVVSE